MKIYTRTGDRGTTGLFGGARVMKDHVRIEAYGAVDEANAILGLARAHLHADERLAPLDDILRRLQSDLFVLGADLASPPETRARPPRINVSDIEGVERLIDAHEEDLNRLTNFILPAGNMVSALLHQARTVTRRCERAVVHAAHTEYVRQEDIMYLNRLSDLLFVLARWANAKTGTADEPWFPGE